MPRSLGRASLATAIAYAILLALITGAWFVVRGALQYRATYEGGLTLSAAPTVLVHTTCAYLSGSLPIHRSAAELVRIH